MTVTAEILKFELPRCDGTLRGAVEAKIIGQEVLETLRQQRYAQQMDRVNKLAQEDMD